ncbi:baseplate J/gp47 family protein [Azonexus sp. R2A61]|uniref:baseplate J/gp47 family protein n=1 Tax=Azonexus sp. R2A61 TaxID=2744443 RepID=UPI001F2274E5|nr:baseplate J/gp47 family protein [Azonexus sp. R2A61]
MPWVTPTHEQIRDGILRDIKNLNEDADIAKDSDHWVRATATASAILGIYQHQEWLARQILEDKCDEDFLVRRAARVGMSYKPAVAATGTLRFTGQVGAAVPVLTEAKRTDGAAYVTTESGVIPAGGVLDLAAQAVTAGAGGNTTAGLVLTLTSAPSGVQNRAAVVQMTGGDDKEDADGLLQRLLRRLRLPPQGGADHDYVDWAEAVAGVRFGTTAVYHERRNYRSLDVVIRAVGGLPSTQLVEAVQAAVDAKRPPTADVLVIGPTAVAVAVAARLVLDGISLADAEHAIRAALEEYFDSLQPGDSAVWSRILAVIASIDGVADVTLIAPAANVPAPVDTAAVRLCVLGTLTLSLAGS